MIYGRSPLSDEIPEGLRSKAGRLADLSPTWTADPRRHLGNPDIVIMWRNVRSSADSWDLIMRIPARYAPDLDSRVP